MEFIPIQRTFEKVRNWAVHHNVENLSRFLRLAIYYHRFVKGFADIAKHLYNNKMTWTAECSDAFRILKKESPILTLTNLSG